METLVIERNDRLFVANQARVVKSADDLDADMASEVKWDIAQGSPYVKWIQGNYAQSGEPNNNKQFWTAGDLEFGEYSIRYSPMNVVHRVRNPVGFFLQTRKVFLDQEQAQDTPKNFRIEALGGMWSHIFPFESTLVDQADSSGLLFLSMECRGKKITCAGENGCGETFDYMAKDDHCEHIKERKSIRHIVEPTFRGGALIVPPVRPGWSEATATVYEESVMQEAAKYAEQTESQYESAKTSSDMTPSMWEHLMASIISVSDFK